MQIDVIDMNGKSVKKVSLPDDIFGVPLNDNILHLAVKAYRSNRRQGTHATKTRSNVSGTGKKPFKQKGNGTARQGTLRGPHQPGGAVVLGPQPRRYTEKMNRSAKLLALRVALSDRARHKKLVVVSDFALSQYSTKHVAKFLGVIKSDSALLTDERKDDYLYRSARNIYRVAAVAAGEMNAEHVLAHEHLVLSENALAVLQQRLGGK